MSKRGRITTVCLVAFLGFALIIFGIVFVLVDNGDDNPYVEAAIIRDDFAMDWNTRVLTRVEIATGLVTQINVIEVSITSKGIFTDFSFDVAIRNRPTATVAGGVRYIGERRTWGSNTLSPRTRSFTLYETDLPVLLSFIDDVYIYVRGGTVSVHRDTRAFRL